MYIRYLYVFENKTRWVPNVTQAYIKNFEPLYECQKLYMLVQKKSVSDQPRWVPDVTQDATPIGWHRYVL